MAKSIEAKSLQVGDVIYVGGGIHRVVTRAPKDVGGGRVELMVKTQGSTTAEWAYEIDGEALMTLDEG